MASTYLGRSCKPWLRFHRDTWRVNESPREAREHFASRLKGFRITVVVVVGFSFLFLMKRKLSPPEKKYLGTIKASTRMILVHVQKMYKTCTEDVQYIKNIIRVNGSVKVRGIVPARRLM